MDDNAREVYLQDVRFSGAPFYMSVLLPPPHASYSLENYIVVCWPIKEEALYPGTFWTGCIGSCYPLITDISHVAGGAVQERGPFLRRAPCQQVDGCRP